MHLDINPSNIMFEPYLEIWPKGYLFIDLGVSKWWEDRPFLAPANLQFASLGAIQGFEIAPWADHESFAYSLLHLQGLQLPWMTCKDYMEVSPVSRWQTS